MNRFNLHLYFSASFDNCHIVIKVRKSLDSTKECFIKCLRYQNMKQGTETIVMNKTAIK